MKRLEISNLSFCELAVDNNVEVKGGAAIANSFLYDYLNSLVTRYFAPAPLEKGTTNIYLASSPDGTSTAGVIVGQTSKISFASSVYYS